MSVRKSSVAVTTASDGTATAYSPHLTGKLAAIHYIKPVSGYYTDGVDFTITSEATGETLWTETNINASTWRMPRGAVHTTAGVAALYASGGVAVLDQIRLVSSRVKIVIADGGSVKTGTFLILVED